MPAGKRCGRLRQNCEETLRKIERRTGKRPVEVKLNFSSRLIFETCKKSNKKHLILSKSGVFSGCGGRTRTYGLRVMSAPGVISPHILWASFKKYHAVSLCLLFAVMPSRSVSCHIKGGQKEVNRQFEYDRVLHMLTSYFELTHQSVPFEKEST